MCDLNEIQELKGEFVSKLNDYLSQDKLYDDERMEILIDVMSFPSKTVLHFLLETVNIEENLIVQRLKNEFQHSLDID